MSLFDRVAAGLDQIGKKTQQVFDESKLRMDLGRARRRKDVAARDLGYLTHRQAKGEEVNPAAVDTLVRRIASIAEEIAGIETEIAKVKGEGQGPAPADAPPPEAGGALRSFL